ncbi:hypothetical protein DY000_02051320 [Brassica cretica]|uniref:Shikimate dehydrogenase n=1 Tax=Brassica cretica TaxID=69181 RepID=A0ABQ7F2L7_BRACR|nr:hypothetical protein DY000_02051320 [Brassica cretica]
MAPSSSANVRPSHILSIPRPSPTCVPNLRLLASGFSLIFKSSYLSAELSSRQTRSVQVPVVSSTRKQRRSMEQSNVYVASNSMETEIGSQEITKNPSLICAPVMADSINKMVTETCKARELGADLVEIRLDSLKGFNPLEDLKTIIKKSPLPTLFTYRPKWEGGQYDGDDNERLDVLRLAMELGADYIDVELQVASEFIKSIKGKKPKNFRVIVSSHNYQNTPSLEDLNDLAVSIQRAGADIVKIVTTAVDITDVARMFHITSNSQIPTIGLVMGQRGLMSHILCSKFGGYLTFGTLESGKVSASGQPTIKDLLDLYNFRRIGPDTKVYGVIGQPVSHSKSPVVHNQAFKSVDFNGVYVHLLVDDIASFLKAYSSSDFVGFRRQSDGKLMGYNTDCIGSISAIEDGLRSSSHPSSVRCTSASPLAGKTVVVIGAGGAGKAVAYGAKVKGAKVVIANRTYERALEVAEAIGGRAVSLADLENFHPEEGMVLANTTSVGMQPNVDETPISKHALKHYALVFDAVYTPRVTRLLREAEECGAVTVSGSEMFVRQAYEQFEIFTGLPAPKELYWKVMSKY